MREITFGETDARAPALAQHVLTGALREAARGRAARQGRREQPPRLRSSRRPSRRHRAHPRPQGHLVARQLPGRLRRAALDGAQAPGHPLPRPYGRRATRRRRAAHGTSVARRGVVAPDAAVADVGPVGRGGDRPPPRRRRVAPGLAAAAGQATWSRPSCWWRASGRPSAGWSGGSTPPYELLDTGVHTVHHRLARRWRVGRVFLAGDAAHLLGALGTQGLDEGLRDADNLAWKLALAWHHGPHEALLDSYQAERRAVVAARLRAADQALPILRGGGGLRSYVPGSARGHDALLTDGHLGRGPLGAPGAYADSPLAPPHAESQAAVDTAPGAPVADVRVTAEDGSFVRLRDRLGRGALLVVLIAPGTGRVGARALGDGRDHAPARGRRDRAAAPGRAAGRGELPGRRRAHRAAGPPRRAPGHRAERGASGRAVRGGRGDAGRRGEAGGDGHGTARRGRPSRRTGPHSDVS